MTHASQPSAVPADMPGPPGKLVLVGAGKMGGALLRGWLEAGVAPGRIVIVDPALSPDMHALAAEHAIAVHGEIPALAETAAVVLAVKPQMVAPAAQAVRARGAEGVLILSIAAGKSVADISAQAAPAPIVRAMPNTPAAIGRGITAAFAGAGVSAEQRALATWLLQAVGAVVWLDDERLMDAVTALSGSGPAYVFLLTECMAAAGGALGLPAALAEQLARATVSGAGDLLRHSDAPAGVLRANVTSPGGTTAAALSVLMAEEGLGLLMRQAMTAARDRAREL